MRLESSDVDRKKYGLISRMAAGSKGCIGFLPAASFCERVNSVAKDVMTDAHTLMCDEALEMLVVLRINRKFMSDEPATYRLSGLFHRVHFAPVRYFFDDDKRGVTTIDEHRFAQCRVQMFG